MRMAIIIPGTMSSASRRYYITHMEFIDQLSEVICWRSAHRNDVEFLLPVLDYIFWTLDDFSLNYGWDHERSWFTLDRPNQYNHHFRQKLQQLLNGENLELQQQQKQLLQQFSMEHLKEELFTLGCQALVALPEGNDALMKELARGIALALGQGVHIEMGVRYLSTERLNTLHKNLEAERKRPTCLLTQPPAGQGRERLFKAAAETVQKILRERTVQDLCVVKILHAVEGDARKVWSLSELPDSLKELFHIPFRELYQEPKS